MSIPYTATTRGIRVTVRATYLEDQSDPDGKAWVWAYRVEISNLSRVAVRLLKRTWLITDGAGQTIRVHGDGVVGEQPLLEPGDEFTYTSGTPLATPTGFMRGQYHMIEAATGEEFDVAIPAFSLDSPHQMGGLH